MVKRKASGQAEWEERDFKLFKQGKIDGMNAKDIWSSYYKEEGIVTQQQVKYQYEKDTPKGNTMFNCKMSDSPNFFSSCHQDLELLK